MNWLSQFLSTYLDILFLFEGIFWHFYVIPLLMIYLLVNFLLVGFLLAVYNISAIIQQNNIRKFLITLSQPVNPLIIPIHILSFTIPYKFRRALPPFHPHLFSPSFINFLHLHQFLHDLALLPTNPSLFCFYFG